MPSMARKKSYPKLSTSWGLRSKVLGADWKKALSYPCSPSSSGRQRAGMTPGSDSVFLVSSGGFTPQTVATRALEVWGTTAWALSAIRLLSESSSRKGVVSISSLYAVVDRARVDSRKIRATLRFSVSGVGERLVFVGRDPGGTVASTSVEASSFTTMFARGSRAKALPALVTLGTTERQKSTSAAMATVSGVRAERSPPSAEEDSQVPVIRRVIRAGPAST